MIKRLKKLTKKLKNGRTKIHSSPLFLRVCHNKDIISYWVVMTIVIYASLLTKTIRERQNVRRENVKNSN